MPLAEVCGVVSGGFEGLGEGDFLGSQVVAVVEDVGAHGGAAGEDAGTGGGADGGGGVEAIEDDGRPGHGVEVRGF